MTAVLVIQQFRSEVSYTSDGTKIETIHTPGGGTITRYGRFTFTDRAALDYEHLIRPFPDDEGWN